MSVDKYTKEVTLKPGVKEFLEMLKEKGIGQESQPAMTGNWWKNF